MYEVDDLVRSYRMSLDSDPEYSGPAEDLFKSQKAKIEKQLKAFEIIKKKMVNLYQIWVYDDYEKYKYYYPFSEYHAVEAMLTLEEFKLIKEVVGE